MEPFIQRLKTFLDERVLDWKQVDADSIVAVCCRCSLPPGPTARFIPLLLPLLERYYPYFSAGAGAQPHPARGKPRRRIS